LSNKYGTQKKGEHQKGNQGRRKPIREFLSYGIRERERTHAMAEPVKKRFKICCGRPGGPVGQWRTTTSDLQYFKPGRKRNLFVLSVFHAKKQEEKQ